MTRLVLAVIGALGGAAIAAPPAESLPTIAIVVDAKQVGSVKVAQALGSALRTRSALSKLHRPSKTDKEIEQAVVKAECKVIQPACAASVGAALTVDYVLAGEIDMRGNRHVLVLSLVNVLKKQRVRSLRESVLTSVNARRWAQTIYKRIADDATGELIVIANAKQGEVLLDGQSVGALFEGRVTVSGLPLGMHELSIRAPGFRPLDLEITIDGATKETILLEPL